MALRKKILLLFTLILLSSFVSGFDYMTNGVPSCNNFCPDEASYFISNLTNGDYYIGYGTYSSGVGNGGWQNITFDDTYTITEVQLLGVNDGSGSVKPADFEIYVGDTRVGIYEFDGTGSTCADENDFIVSGLSINANEVRVVIKNKTDSYYGFGELVVLGSDYDTNFPNSSTYNVTNANDPDSNRIKWRTNTSDIVYLANNTPTVRFEILENNSNVNISIGDVNKNFTAMIAEDSGFANNCNTIDGGLTWECIYPTSLAIGEHSIYISVNSSESTTSTSGALVVDIIGDYNVLEILEPLNNTHYNTPELDIYFNLTSTTHNNATCNLTRNDVVINTTYFQMFEYQSISPSATSYNNSWTNPDNAYDGDWDTYASPGAGLYNSIFYNFTKLDYYNKTLLQIKDGCNGLTNVTLSNYCMDNGYDEVLIKAYSHPAKVEWSCWNGTTWRLQSYCAGANRDIYEAELFQQKNAYSFTETFNSTTEAQYNYSVSCYQPGNSGSIINSNEVMVYIDNIDPIVTSPLSTNNTVVDQYLHINLTFTDTYLYGFNVSIDDKVLNTTTGLSDTYQLNYYNYYYVGNLSLGMHTISGYATDGHTAKYIDPYNVKKDLTKKELKFEFDQTEAKFVKVYPKESKDFTESKATKKIDRYNFEFKRDKLKVRKDSYDVFYVESSSKIDYIYTREIPDGFLVIPGENKWLDFVTEENYKVIYNKISDYKYQVKVYGDPTKDYTFNSIGDLNVVYYEYEFYKFNTTRTFTNYTVESYDNTFTYELQYNISANITINDVEFYFGGSSQTTSQTSSTTGDVRTVTYTSTITMPVISSDTDYEHYWNVNLSSGSYDFYNTTSVFNHTVLNLSFSTTCDSSHPFEVINISFYDELTDDPVNATTVGQPIYFKHGSYIYSGIFNYQTGYTSTMCSNINSSIANFSSLEHYGDYLTTATDYGARFYIIDPTLPETLSSTNVLYLNFSLPPTANSTLWTGTFYTSDLQLVSGTLLIYKYEAGSRTLLTSKTISAGQVSENLIYYSSLYGWFYSFEVIIDGVVYQDAEFYDPIEIVGDNTFTVNIYSNLLPVMGLIEAGCSLTKVGADGVTMAWDTTDLENYTACIVVERTVLGTSSIIFTNCSSALTGSFSNTIPIYSGNSYHVYGIVNTTDATAYCIDDLYYTETTSTAETFGANGIVAIVFLLMAVILLLGDNIYNLVLGLVAGLLATTLIGLNTLSWGVVSGIIVMAFGIIWFVRYTRQ
jgi:hypothetical protein